MDLAPLLLLLGVLASSFADLKFLLLHNNDMHAHFDPSDQYLGMCADDTSPQCYGGVARLHSQAVQSKKEAAKKGMPTIFLNAGDSYQGTVFYTFFKWPIIAKVVDMLDIDVMCLGNHEFDGGIPELAPFIKNVSVPIVSSNLDLSQEPSMVQPHLTPSYILTVGETRVGVIGYLTPDTKTLSDIGKVQILDEIPSIRAEAKKLISQNVSIIIALGHSGYAVDQEIARQVEEVDIVVGGHTHTFLYTGTPPDIDVPRGPYPTVITQSSGKQVPVVQAFWGTKYLGYLEVTFDNQGNLKNFSGAPILLTGDLPQDPNIVHALKPYEDEISEMVRKIVGDCSVFLDNNDQRCKLGECNLGNLVTDAYVDYVSRNISHPNGWTIASVGLNQAGGFRSSINPKTNIYQNGSITLGDVIQVIPWGAKIVIMNVTGEVLLEALEFSVARYEETNTGHVSEFLQVSGLQVVYDIRRPKGSRVVKVSVLCADCDVPFFQPLNTTASYGVVLPEFVATGGDGYYMFGNITNHITIEDLVDYELVTKYIETHSPVHPVIEGRITILGADSKSAASSLLTNALLLWVITISLCMLQMSSYLRHTSL